MDIALTAIAIGIGIAIAAAFGAIAQSRAIHGAVESIARQPEAGGRIFTSLIIGLALIETLVIYTLLVTGIFLKANLDDMIKAKYGAKNIILADSMGIIHKERKGLNPAKKEIVHFTNIHNVMGMLHHALVGADVFIGVSAPNILNANDIKKMNIKPVVFTMSNPVPEISPEEAKKGGAEIIATGSSRYPNQINNVLVFPGIFRGAFDTRTKKITDEHKLKAAKAIASLVKKPNCGKIIPEALDPRVVKAVAGVFTPTPIRKNKH